MRPFLVNIPEDRLAELKRLSAVTGAPMAALIRRAVDGMLYSGAPGWICTGTMPTGQATMFTSGGK